MKLCELRAACRELLGDETRPYLWSDETLDRLLNNSVREACIRLRLMKDDAQTLPRLCAIPVDAGQQYVKYDNHILCVRSARFPGQADHIWALSASSLDKIHPDWERESQSPGWPRYMAMDLAQKTLRLDRPLAEANILQLRVWRSPLDEELMKRDDDTPKLEIPGEEELKHWVAHEAYLKNDSETYDAARSTAHLQLFEQRFGSRPTLHDMARWADSPPRVRFAHMF